MVLVSTITIKGTPGSTISVTKDDGGRITLVVRGAHVAREDIVLVHEEKIERADQSVGTQNCGIQDAGAGLNQAAETQQEKKKDGEEEGCEVIEAVTASSPPSSLSSLSSSSTPSSTTSSPEQDYNEPFYRLLALMLDNTYKHGTFWMKENHGITFL